MSSQILFRSKKTSKDTFGNSQTYIKQRGSSWSHLRLYNNMDDIRDIAWNKIKPEGISVRVRENNGDFNIISYWGETDYDEFFIHNPNISRKNTIQKYRTLLSKNAKLGGHTYHEYVGTKGLGNIIQKQPKNNLIFICNLGEITDEIKLLAFHNDVIYLDLYHPFEKNPNDNILFSGQIVHLEKYRKAYQEYIDNLKKRIHQIHGSYVSISTEDDLVKILNIFFKKRYTSNG
ncbi:hypothetical protein K2X92_03045 [Candidatus Gracilibacteria bacterium]|nr:hypothetical protein [Candidatus Gracilibacteria bacterium]